MNPLKTYFKQGKQDKIVILISKNRPIKAACPVYYIIKMCQYNLFSLIVFVVFLWKISLKKYLSFATSKTNLSIYMFFCSNALLQSSIAVS